MNQIVNMIIRMVMNKVINRGVNAGINRALGPKASQGPLTAAQKTESDAARANTKRAKQAMRVARKVGRF